MQQGDFEGIYEAMEGLPVTIRFLDPPLHEFVPTEEADIEQLAKDMGKSVAEIKAIIAGLHEFNPMMGHRGCRLAVTYPEIAAMQTRAVIKAALNVQAKHPEWTMVPEIMIPLVGEVKELAYVKKVVVETADAIIKEAGSDMKYQVGTMIEIPRAALTADEIAKQADFFSFGTNDLTQMTFGFSRDDAGKFLDAYYDKKIYENDPFAKLDQTGVGKLVEMACKMGRADQPRAASGHLRRARRRPLLCGVLPPDGPGLCVLLSLPGAHRPAGCGTGCHQGRTVRDTSKPHISEKRRPGSMSRGGAFLLSFPCFRRGAFRAQTLQRLPLSVRPRRFLKNARTAQETMENATRSSARAGSQICASVSTILPRSELM